MTHEEQQSQLIDLIDGQLPAAEAEHLRQRMASDDALRQQYEQLRELLGTMDRVAEQVPPASLRQSFEEALHEEQHPGKQVWIQPWTWRLAAGVVLAALSVVIWQWDSQRRELAAMRKQMEETRQLMLAQLANTQSASTRLMGASVAYELPQADDEIVRVLTKAMNTDDNTNVRLAALEALARFYRDTSVRTQLIQSLETQTDPVVQIELIRLLVQMKEESVAPSLRKMTEDETIMKAVKDEAHRGLLRLS
jgi:anti-sigma factor RsiW